MLDHNARRIGHQRSRKGYIQQVTVRLPVVGRVKKHDIGFKSLARKQPQGCEDVLLDDAVACIHSAEPEVVANQAAPRLCIFDKYRLARATAQGLNADRARASENIQYNGTGNAWSKDIEQSFLQAVPRGTDIHPIRTFQPPPSIFARNNSHMPQKDALRMANG